jgi:hypothetical protein
VGVWGAHGDISVRLTRRGQWSSDRYSVGRGSNRRSSMSQKLTQKLHLVFLPLTSRHPAYPITIHVTHTLYVLHTKTATHRDGYFKQNECSGVTNVTTDAVHWGARLRGEN